MLGWIGNIFIIGGLWSVGNKNRDGFLLSIIGEAAYILRSVRVHDWSLAFVCVIFLAMAVRGYIKWA